MAQITVTATLDNLSEVTDFVERRLAAAGCSAKLTYQIVIATEEIYVNIARYAYQHGVGDATVLCELRGEPRAAVIRFEDVGAPYDPLSREEPDVSASAEDREIGGLGVLMAKRLMDSVKYEYSGGRNILTMMKRLDERA